MSADGPAAARLERVLELYEEVSTLGGEERQARLAAIADDEIAREVRELLEVSDRAERYFDELGDEVTRAAGAELEARAGEGRRIGAYRTLGMIGRGGMGTVYLAERADDQFEQQVAIKLVRADAVSPERLRRFHAERRILASLDHPNIARLLDGGVDDRGTPYLVMELVRGRPVIRYCDDEKLSVGARLRLFRDVAAAVSHAHRSLVVHRDLKPSNIVVTTEGQVKLLDFGIAKMLPAPGELPATETRSLAMTPEYAAPEQFDASAVTTATDVYGLGAVLYELLSGARPLTLEGLTPGAAEEHVRTTTPRLASAVVRDAAPETAAARSSSPARLARRLAGDLDVICATALRKEPERRYRSVEALDEDIRRHLDGLPVTARRETYRYRAGKFLGRHRIATAATALLFSVVLTFAVISSRQATRLERERDKAERVTDLLTEAFRVYEPGESAGTAVPALDALDRGVMLVESELSGQPEVQADLLDAIGRIYTHLGHYEPAEETLERSLALRRDSNVDSGLGMATSLDRLAEVHEATGEYARAVELHRDALERLRTGDGAPSEIAAVSNHLGGALLKLGSYDEAESVLGDALSLHRSLGPEGELGTAQNLNNLGALFYTRGDYETAEGYHREAAAIRRTRLGEDHPLVAASLSNLANTLSRLGRFDAAEEAQSEALGIRRRYLGDEHPHVATSLNNLALILFSRGDYERAEPLLRDSLRIRRARLRPGHPDQAQSLSNLGLLLQTTGRLEEAEVLYREALAIRREAFGEQHRLTGQSVNNLGLLLQAKGELEEAEVLLREAADRFEHLLGEDHPTVATCLSNLGAVLYERGELQGSEALFARSLAIRRQALPDGHPHLSYSHLGLGRVHLALDRPELAREHLQQALSIRRSHYGPDHPLTAEVESAMSP